MQQQTNREDLWEQVDRCADSMRWVRVRLQWFGHGYRESRASRPQSQSQSRLPKLDRVRAVRAHVLQPSPFNMQHHCSRSHMQSCTELGILQISDRLWAPPLMRCACRRACRSGRGIVTGAHSTFFALLIWTLIVVA